MAPTIRQLNGADAAAWIELLKEAFGNGYPDSRVYDPHWVVEQLDPVSGHETWGAVDGNRLLAVVSFLQPGSMAQNPVLNLGRQMFSPPSFANGSALALWRRVSELSGERRLTIVARVLAADRAQQDFLEQIGFVCAGFQPLKHFLGSRFGTLFYVWFAKPDIVPRLPLSDSLPAVNELAAAVLTELKFPHCAAAHDGGTGYPLRLDLEAQEVDYSEFARCRLHAQPPGPPAELSNGYNLGAGLLRTPAKFPIRALLARRHNAVVAGLAFVMDDQDQCVRLVDSFNSDELSLGALLNHAVKLARDKLQAVYLEADILVTAPRLLKTADQLGFVPVAYLPAFHFSPKGHTDVIKAVKLNLSYSPETAQLSPRAQAILQIVDRNFHDQKQGISVVNLLRGLPIFDGLGDGELHKISRLFTQKLYRPGEKVFSKGETGNTACVVMRGQVEIRLEESGSPIAVVNVGQIFGELAFLDNTARAAHAIATQASIVLVIQRAAFDEMVQREPHLGLVITRNIALELSNRLRRANLAGRK